MSDPVGLLSGSGGVRPVQPGKNVQAGAQADGASFKDVLVKTLDEVNTAQREADKAVEDLVSGNRDDVEGVILATEKADTAFRMLQAMRNRVMQAYEEVKQVRT